MHHDSFSLGFLGDQNIERASEILWNRQTQSWDIRFVGEPLPATRPAPEYCGFRRYDDARAFEVMVMNQCLRNGCGPYNYEIRMFASMKRK